MSSSQTYPVTVEIIQDFLETLDPKEPCGVTKSSQKCLVARTLAWKYGKPFAVDGSHYWSTDTVLKLLDPVGDLLPEEVRRVVRKFDDLSLAGFIAVEVTREQVETGIPTLLRGKK